MLTKSRHWAWNLGIIAVLAILYGGMFALLYPLLGFAGAPFAAVTVVMAAWLFGIRGGIIASLIIGLENLVLLRLMGETAWLAALKNGSLAGFVALGVVGIAVGRMSDLDRKVKQHAFELQHQAFHDPLTNLPNRTLFSDRLEHATARAARGTTSLAVLFLDLDGFKWINDHHGHAVGDRLLQAVGTRMKETVRESDTVARLGGDEFVVLVEDIDGLDSARYTADRISKSLSRPFVIDGMTHSITASIGVAFCSAGESRSEDMLREADQAMYVAKASGRARYEVGQALVA